MDVESATLDSRENFRRRSPSPIRKRFSRSHSRSRSRSRDRYNRDRTPERRRRYSRSPPRHYRRRSPPRHQNRRTREIIRGSDEERMRSCSIFVGNLPYSFEERDVVNLFERFGKLRQISVPIDRYTRRNRGFAFVEFEQRPDAEDAFNKYNGYDMEGRKLRLDWDIGRTAKEGARGDRSPRRDYRRSPPRDRSPMRERSPVRERSPIIRDRSPIVRDRSPIRDRSPAGARSPPPARFERDADRGNEYR